MPNDGSRKTVEALEKEGIGVTQVDFSESEKFAIAGLDRSTFELIRYQPGPLPEETT